MKFNMKNNYGKSLFRSVLLSASALLLFGCNDLELDESLYLSKIYQFSDFDKVKEVMTNVYGYVGSGFAAIGNTMIDSASDDVVYASTPDPVKTFYDGSWSASNLIDDQWGNLYAGIRAANYLLENCPEDFPDSKYNDDYSRNIEQLVNYPWEARALRAYFHAELLKRYGSIVIADRTYSKDEVNDLHQVSYDEAAEWIAKELAEAAEHLPDTYSGTYFAEIGRVTKGFALAARARVLLYAASPLNNPSGDIKKWAEAAAAAKEMIDYCDQTKAYELSDFSVATNAESKTVIFCVRENASGNFERENFPIGYEGGNSGMCPSMNLVEAFDMADGSSFDYAYDKNALLDPSKRDPRFARYIISNGDSFKGETVESFTGGKNGQPLANATPTSFYLRKFVIENTSFTVGNMKTYVHIYPLFRMAEVYLNYAEALFEATGELDFKGALEGADYTMSPMEALNKVRTLSGMPPLATADRNEFRRRLRNERRVELCFEGHRFWDLRRWKIGPDTEDIYGLSIAKNSDDSFTVEKILVQKRIWSDKMYWYPISDKELHKNLNFNQNQGWN